MLLMPAIDLKNGRCVRLLQGRWSQETVYGEDPLAMAQYWEELGAPWLHVVDLDGAFTGQPAQLDMAGAIARSVSVPVQLGGGMRNLKAVEQALDQGLERVIVGTGAAQDPQFLQELGKSFPDRVAVSLDVREGYLAVSGWVEATGQNPADFLPSLQQTGLYRIICTDVSRDGTLAGVDPGFLEPFLDQNLEVFLAGGVCSLEDIEALLPLAPRGLQGIILGRALYAGTLQLRQALALLEKESRRGE